MDPILERYQALENKVKAYNPSLDTGRLFDAFSFADNAHSGQLRKDGSPYITHPLAVAEIVADLELDTDSIIAALLHDTIEDTTVTHKDISKRFGEPVALLVEGVTKLSRVQYVTKEEQQMENLRKMLMAMAKDIRVILIKICDRLHNMRTMEYQSARKQREKARETLEIYAPLAHRLGMQRIKWELEDTSLKYLDPVGYQEIANELMARSAVHEEFLAGIQKQIQDRMDSEHIKCKVYGRVKHIYSIYRKMYEQSKTLDEIFDLYAFRVIVEDQQMCYYVLGSIHDMFNPVLGRFKDYISTPKPNGYQSLHTTLIGREGIPFEVQIRTVEMHNTAEYGIAAHWKYKRGMANKKLGTEEAFEWVRKLLESQQDSDPDEFVRSLKVDLFADEVFVFTPQGDVKSLPAGATPIDFAYSIHSAVGNHMTGAKINGRLVPFDTKLTSGDIVEIITSKTARGPSRGWLDLCKSNEARNKIRQWFKKECREENIITGRALFETELKHQELSLAEVTREEILPVLLRKVRFGTLEELYNALGYGGVSPVRIVTRIRDELLQMAKPEKNDRMPLEKMGLSGEIFRQAPDKEKAASENAAHRRKTGIIVEGLDNCMIKLAKCCTPVRGDPIIGFITRGFGVSIHRADCPNAQREKRTPDEINRWIKAEWGDQEEPQEASKTEMAYRTALELSAKDRDGLAFDVTAALTKMKVPLTRFSAKTLPDDYAILWLVVQVRDLQELTYVMNKLQQIPNVYQVKRATE